MRKVKYFNKREKGITLIALVVTIIVLLILAGVSIQMITGQSGILNQARQAKEETTKGQIRDNVRREIMEKMAEKYGEDLTVEELKAILDNYFSDAPGLEEDVWNAENFPTSFPELHSLEGNYLFRLSEIYSSRLSETQTDRNEKIQITLQITETTYNSITLSVEVADNGVELSETGTYNYYIDEEKNPRKTSNKVDEDAKKCKYTGIDPTKEHVLKVIVTDINGKIKDAQADVAKIWDLNKVIPTPDVEGNVIPVPKGFYYMGGTKDTGIVISDNEKDNLNNSVGENQGNQFVWVPVPNAKSDGIISNKVNTIQFGEIDSTMTPMAEKDETGNYRGILYQGWNMEAKTVQNIQYNTNGCREPDILTNYDGTANDPIKIKKEDLQIDYNEMVESVSKYGGFYVARYEMSLSSDEKAEYKKGKESKEASNIKDQWYGLYKKQKEFANENPNVKSTMIWGCQYDAMINWIAKCGENVNERLENGRNKTRKTGLGNTGLDDSKDIVNNIYDLYGNLLEWTLETIDVEYRADRGGYYGDYTGSPYDYSPKYRGGRNPINGVFEGSRATLYISI